MLSTQLDTLRALLSHALQPILAGTDLQPTLVLEKPKQAEHGDIACTVALQIAKPLKQNPRLVAEQLIQHLLAQPDSAALIASAEIAGPGFINLRLTPAAKQQVVQAILLQGNEFGRSTAGQAQKVMVEFVSANPTGPLHVGHGRQAALGDALCNLIAANGYTPWREFYYNDAGNQIHNLAISVQCRAKGLTPESADWPADGYRGDYITEIAQDFLAQKTVQADDRSFTANGNPEDLDNIRQFAVAYLRHEQDLDLQAFGVQFDHYYLESSLYTEGKVEQAVQALIDAGKTFEQEGALWLRTTDYGDDKDRVMRKSEGGYTYFVPDVAYHINKWQRGFVKVINVQGTDHAGTIARVRAGLQAANVGIPQGFPDYILHSMVKVMRNGEEVKISKRAGSYVTVRDLIEWVGRDAVRFFLVSRKADSEFVFDIDLALSQSEDNPVFYVQYAHARICSVFEKAAQEGHALDTQADLAPLTSEREYALMAKLAAYPKLLQDAFNDLAPHSVAYYLKDLAAELHSYYNAERVLVDDTALRQARLALLAATRQVLKNGLAILGVSAPERMERVA
ncbi:arginine--tRNA ligase [Parvibium lacunae]|uniref:Arginine--tRNA ligase n=1 Tax=Parvibium lacunae TaxID=1888893 RepID=A0A368L0M4_9BURK|nr:arginine--tRNA ligase [Parvibium lacunae]RCS57096.1 arginine--tRNA ligase [Parvibium lacunae]